MGILTVYVVNPELTVGENDELEKFFLACRKELERYIDVIIISSEQTILSIEIKKSDIIAIFNKKSEESYESYLIEFLEQAVSVEALILPVALDKNSRIPFATIGKSQSYDIHEKSRQRTLTREQIGILGVNFARTIISNYQPTLSRLKMNLFISHRRLDGEEIAGKFFDDLNRIEESSFRDINKVLAGEDAQKIIEENLKKSDVVIFLDTPKSGESKWIAKELEIAMARGIPIVWIKLGNDENRSKEFYYPVANQPHLELTSLDPQNDFINQETIEKIIQKAFEMIRESSKTVLGFIKRIKKLNESNLIQLKQLDSKYLIYRIDIPRRGKRYFERPMTHIVSFYGRMPHEKEKSKFIKHIQKLGYETHPEWGNWYDSTIMLAPIFFDDFLNEDLLVEEDIKLSQDRIDSCSDYLNTLESYLDESKNKKLKIIISGAFPDSTGDEQHHITDAIRAFVQAIFSRGHTVIFGAHPTFRPLIFNIAKQMKIEDRKENIQMYISEEFLKAEEVLQIKNKENVFVTKCIKGDRNKSLTFMRQKMINESQADCMIVIGGQFIRKGIISGVDEEIEIAKKKRIPVFLIGAAGGRAGQLATEMLNQNKNDLNNLSEEFNSELLSSLDFNALANDLMNKL